MKTYTNDHHGLNQLMEDNGLPERFGEYVCWPQIAEQRPEVIEVIRRQLLIAGNGYDCRVFAREFGDPDGLLYRRCSEVGSGYACLWFARENGDPEGLLYRRCAAVGDGYECREFALEIGDPEGILAARIKQLEESQ